MTETKMWNGKLLLGWTKEWAEANEAWRISRNPLLKKELKVKIPEPGELPTLTREEWKEVMEPSSRRLATGFLANYLWRDNLLMQLSNAIKPLNGVLSEESVEDKKLILSWFLDHCSELCELVDIDRFRMVYEALRDSVSNIKRDGVKDAYYLRCYAVETLTNVLVKLDVPRHDTRLTKKHVEFLFRMLNGAFVGLVYPEFCPGEGTVSKLKRFDHSKEVAARCLLQLEKAYPGFLALEAGSLLQCMLEDAKSKTRQDGHPLILVTATVLGNVCSQYQAQQRQWQRQRQRQKSTLASHLHTASTIMSEHKMKSEIVERSHGDLDEEEEDGGGTKIKAIFIKAPKPLSDKGMFEADDSNWKGKDTSISEQFSEDETRNIGKEAKGKEIVESVTETSLKTFFGCPMSNLTPQEGPVSSEDPQSSKCQALADVLTCASASAYGRLTPNSGESSVGRPSLKSALRRRPVSPEKKKRVSFGDTVKKLPAPYIPPHKRKNMNASKPAATTAATEAVVPAEQGSSSCSSLDISPKSPGRTKNVSIGTRMPLLVNKSTACPEIDTAALSKLLKKFTVPVYVDCLQHPSYYVTDDSKQSLKRAISFFVARAVESNAETLDALVSNLPCILESAEISPAQVMSIASTLLRPGTSTLLRAVLSIHDQAPKLFGNQGSRKLVERMFRLINELECPQDQKLDALTWILRLHASQRFNQGDTLYLADCWRELLLRPTDSMQVALLKIKGLSACLAVGIGMEDVVCHNVLLWNGFDQKPTSNNKKDGNGGGIGNTNTKFRTMTYALRKLYNAVEDSHSNSNLLRSQRLRAHCILSTMVAIVLRPEVIPAVDDFLDSCDPQVASRFLHAFAALLCAVDRHLKTPNAASPTSSTSVTTPPTWIDSLKTAIAGRLQTLWGSPPPECTPAAKATRHTKIQLPSTFEDPKAIEAWLSDPATWEPLAAQFLKQDLLPYRTLLRRFAPQPSCQYSEAHEAHPSLSLVADAILGIRQKKLARMPLGIGVVALRPIPTEPPRTEELDS